MKRKNCATTKKFTCDQPFVNKHNSVEEIYCGLMDVENHKVKYFSVYTSSEYPSLEKSAVTEFNNWPAEHLLTDNSITSQIKNNSWPWYCNRGLTVPTWMKNNTDNRTCMCPPSYYGHLCQYQNQRISITVRLSSNDRYSTYAVVIMLIDDNDARQEINAYDQFMYIVKQTCSVKLNRYLLFPTRPKNLSKNYSVRIDVFEKNMLTYIGSWYFPIAFLFLPVNRLGISLNLSNHLLTPSFNCLTKCENGQCMKYVNQNQSFCRCFPKWSGIKYNIPTNCKTCSSDALCIGPTDDRSVCVCPMNKFGRRCLLISTCPSNACSNNGRCVPADVSIPGNNYTCICSVQFFGLYCQFRKAKLDVSLTDITIPSYLVAYFFTLSNKSDPIETTVLRKFTLFQQSVTFHIAVPFQLVFIQSDGDFYLAVLQGSPKTDVSTSIGSSQKCTSVNYLLNTTVLEMIPYQRIIHFHLLCQNAL